MNPQADADSGRQAGLLHSKHVILVRQKRDVALTVETPMSSILYNELERSDVGPIDGQT